MFLARRRPDLIVPGECFLIICLKTMYRVNQLSLRSFEDVCCFKFLWQSSAMAGIIFLGGLVSCIIEIWCYGRGFNRF